MYKIEIENLLFSPADKNNPPKRNQKNLIKHTYPEAFAVTKKHNH